MMSRVFEVMSESVSSAEKAKPFSSRIGIGTGLAIPTIMTTALEAAPEELAGSASGVLSMSRYFGSIPASILLALLVSDAGDGSTLLLTIGAVGVATALVVARSMPTQLPADARAPDRSVR